MLIIADRNYFASDEYLVIYETVVGDSLQFIPSLEVRRSPGLNQELTSFCGRIHIHGYTRPEHMHKSIKLKIDASTGATSDIDVCFHRLVHLSFAYLYLIL